MGKIINSHLLFELDVEGIFDTDVLGGLTVSNVGLGLGSLSMAKIEVFIIGKQRIV